MPCIVSRNDFTKILAKCVKGSGLKDSYGEMILTRGMSPTFDRDPRMAVLRLMAFAVPFSWILKPNNFEQGLDVAVTEVRRIPPNSVDPTIKNYHWFDLVSGMFETYENGHHVGILVDKMKIYLRGLVLIFSLNKDGLSTFG